MKQDLGLSIEDLRYTSRYLLITSALMDNKSIHSDVGWIPACRTGRKAGSRIHMYTGTMLGLQLIGNAANNW